MVFLEVKYLLPVALFLMIVICRLVFFAIMSINYILLVVYFQVLFHSLTSYLKSSIVSVTGQ